MISYALSVLCVDLSEASEATLADSEMIRNKQMLGQILLEILRIQVSLLCSFADGTVTKTFQRIFYGKVVCFIKL